MIGFLILLLHALVSPLKTQARLEAEIVILRHQLNVLRRRVPWKPEADGGRPTALRVVLSPVSVGVERSDNCPTGDRYSMASKGLSTVPALEVALSGRPRVPMEIRRLIRELSLANRLWGAPRIHGELLKLGIEVAQSTVAKYRARSGRGRSQTWKTFLHNYRQASVRRIS